MNAVRVGRTEAVRLLLDLGADVTKQNVRKLPSSLAIATAESHRFVPEHVFFHIFSSITRTRTDE